MPHPYKYTVLSLLLLFAVVTPVTKAQSPQITYQLENNESGATKTYVARDQIVMKPGFKFENPGSNTFTAKIDAGLLFPPIAYTPITYNNDTIISDPNVGEQVGSIPVQLLVNSNGAFTYTIPIECPIGINGMQPKISLDYNSQSLEDISGLGWSLNAISLISRTDRTDYYDNKSSPIDLSTNDNLLLDGQHLILISGDNLTDGAKYRTEIESYKDITMKLINGFLCFEIYTKEGTKIEYGSRNDSYIEVQGGSIALHWLITKVTDANGNYMTYHYSEDNANGEFVLNKISYTGNNSGMLPVNEICFEYISRPKTTVKFIKGHKISKSLFLKNIKTKSNDTLTDEYILEITTENNNYFLSKIEKGIKNGAKSGIIKFSKNYLSPVYEQLGNTSHNPDPTNTPIDIDDDGINEYIEISNYYDGETNIGEWTLRKIDNYLNAQYYSDPWTYPGSWVLSLLPADLDNDKKTDLVEIRGEIDGQLINNCLTYSYYDAARLGFPCENMSHVYQYEIDFYHNENGTFVKYNTYFTLTADTNEKYSFLITDFDNDNGMELLVKKENGSFIELSLYDLDLLNGSIFFKNSTIVEISSAEMNLTNLNGNSYPDVFLCIEGGNKVFEYDAIENKLKEISFTHNTDASIHDLEFVDYNFDGNTDIFQYNKLQLNWKLRLSTGSELVDASSCPLSRPRQYENDEHLDRIYFGDYNNDGIVDVAHVYKDRLSLWENNESISFDRPLLDVSLSNGSGVVGMNITEGIRYYSPNAISVCWDSNGDGTPEIFSITNRYMFSKGSSTIITGVSTQIQNINIEYAPLISNSVYLSGSGSTSKIKERIFSKPVVSRVETNYSYSYRMGIPELKTYNYKGSKFNYDRGFLGFEEFSENNIQQNKRFMIKSEFDNTYFLPSIKQQTLTTTNNNQIQTIDYTNQFVNLGGKRLFQYVSFQEETDHLQNISSITQNCDYNEAGDPQKIIKTRGDVMETNILSYVQRGSWCKNKIEKIKKTESNSFGTIVRETEYEYDNKGNLTKEITDPLDVNKMITEYDGYDDFGHALTISKTANGITRTSRITYTPSGRFMNSMTNYLNEKTSYKWNETLGLLISEADHYNRTTSYKYNGLGNLYETIFPDGNRKMELKLWAHYSKEADLPMLTIYESPYSFDQFLISRGLHSPVYYKYTQMSGSAPISIYYDYQDKELLREWVGLDGKVVRVFTEYYDNGRGKLQRVSEPTNSTVVEKWAVTYTYDDFGREKTITTNEGTATYTYSGKMTSLTSPNGIKEVLLNDEGQIATSKLNNKSVFFTYSPSGLCKTIVPEGGQPIFMKYNLQGNRVSLTDPDVGFVRTEFNGWGELLFEKQKIHNNLDSVTISYNYYDNGLIQSVTRNNEVTTYTYDSQFKSRIESISIIGKNTQTFVYDSFDRITKVTEDINGKLFVCGIEYDALGRIKKQIYPSGYYTLNQYDANGNLIEIRDKARRSIWKLVEENVWGQKTKIEKGDKEIVYEYDPLNHLIKSIVSPGIIHYTYGYNQENKLDYRKDELTYQRESFFFDPQDRLTRWQTFKNDVSTGTSTIEFDEIGNIKKKSDLSNHMNLTMSYGASEKPHALTSIDGKPDSSPIADLNVTYTDFKKISTITESNRYYELIYGVDGQRRKSEYKLNGQTQITRYYVSNYEEEINSLGKVRKIHYLRGAVLIQNDGVDSLLYTYNDNQGSLLALTDESGNVIRRYAYDPWGVRRNPDDWTIKDDNIGLIINRGYTGHEHLDAFGIINMNGRVYDPLTAQFFSPDPFVQAPENWLNYNRYAYCLGNPLKYIDPSGYLSYFEQEPTDTEPTLSELWFAFIEAGARGWPGDYSDFQDLIYNNTSTGSLTLHTYTTVNSIYYDAEYRCYGVEATSKVANTFTIKVGGSPVLGGYAQGERNEFNLGIPISVVGTAISIGTEYADNRVRTSFKTGRNPVSWSKLSPKQQVWRTANVLGKNAKYVKYAKVTGIVGTGISVGIAMNNIVQGEGTTIDYFDVGIGSASLGAAIFLASNPVGWTIGAGAALYFTGRLVYDIYEEVNY